MERIFFGGPKIQRREYDGIPETVALGGVLFLTKDISDIKEQLDAPREVWLSPQGPLLDGVSTDQIIRVAHLLSDRVSGLGEKALLGLPEASGMSEGTLKASGKKVLVAGELFGKGSSREQAVWALLDAGIAGVLAPSFGTMFENNAVHLGLLTSTNLELAEKIQRGEPIPLEEFLRGKNHLQKEIIRAGGLFQYLKKVKTGGVAEPKISRERDSSRGSNIIEKRFADAFDCPQVIPGEVGLLPIDMVASYVGLSGLGRHVMLQAYGRIEMSLPAEKIFLFEDHFAHSTKKEIPLLTLHQRLFAQELGVPPENYYKGTLNEGGGKGIIHRILLERIDPRKTRVIAITDSHTPTLGALPILAVPVGSSLWAAAIAEGRIPMAVGKTMRVEFVGSLPPGHSIRDAQLELATTVKPAETRMIIEYGGEGLNTLTFEEVAALCNMVPEMFNAEMAVTEAYAAGVKYLKERFGMGDEEAQKLYGKPERNAKYAQYVQYDLRDVVPWIALPEGPNTGVSLTQLRDHPDIQKAYLVSCTLGLQDLVDAAIVLEGKRVASTTRLIVVPSSDMVRLAAEALGVLRILEEAGGEVVHESACGPCIGEGLGAVEKEEVAITASNRNFPGRMGSRSARVFMGGAKLTALAALYGRIPTANEYRQELPRMIEIMKKWESVRVLHYSDIDKPST